MSPPAGPLPHAHAADAERPHRTNGRDDNGNGNGNNSGGGDDSGVATVWAAIGLAVLMIAVLLGLHLGSAVVARHRAAAAADLAALAAATESVLGDGRACARAAGVAGAVGAELTGCALDGWDAHVQVRVPIGLPLPAGGPTLAVARAAAGPVADRRPPLRSASGTTPGLVQGHDGCGAGRRTATFPDVIAVTDGRRMRLALAGSVGVAAVAAAGIALREVSPPADRWVVEHLHAAPGTAAAAVATVVSSAGTLLCLGLVLVGAGAVWLRHRSRGTGLLWRALLLGLVCCSTLVLEGLVQRAGPPQQPEASTFPSGHATVVTAAVFAAVVLCARLGRAWLRGAAAVGGAAALLVCASRVVLAEHWLVDVVAGVVAAVGAGLLAAAVLRISAGAPDTAAGAVRD